MFCIERDNIESQVDRSSADEQVRKINADSFAHLFAMNASGNASNVECQWIHRDSEVNLQQRSIGVNGLRPIWLDKCRGSTLRR
jgi:hypothetical protein